MAGTSSVGPVPGSFAGRVALVAGASRGIGAETARAFARAGAAVVLAARDARALDAVAEAIRAEGGRTIAVPTDVGDAASVERLVGRALTELGRLATRPAHDGGLSLTRVVPTSVVTTDVSSNGARLAARPLDLQ